MWDALRLHDANKYQLEVQQSRLNKAARQQQLRDYLSMQVSAKQENLNVIQTHEKARDHQLLIKRV